MSRFKANHRERAEFYPSIHISVGFERFFERPNIRDKIKFENRFESIIAEYRVYGIVAVHSRRFRMLAFYSTLRLLSAALLIFSFASISHTRFSPTEDHIRAALLAAENPKF